MLAKGVTFFSSNTIALNVFFDFMFSTVIKSPFCPDANAIPYVVIDNLLLPKTTNTVSFLLTFRRNFMSVSYTHLTLPTKA